MRESFRQSMAWLHTWTGLMAGWVLFFVFLTGTFGYVNAEVSHWMRPEEPMLSALPPAADMLAKAEARLRDRAPDAETWSVAMPGGRAEPSLKITWRTAGSAEAARSVAHVEVLDPRSGQPLDLPTVRETGGGSTLYWMHFFLHYVSQDVGVLIVGVCAMMMLVAIFSGVIAHKKIFRDFFTFRPRKGPRSWLDGHNLLGVTALPYHLMITWSGLVFYLFAYMPIGLNVLYTDPVERAAFNEFAYGVARDDLLAARRSATVDAPAPEQVRAPLAPLAPLLARAEAAWGRGNVSDITVHHPNRQDSRITLNSRDTLSLNRRHPPRLQFDGVTGDELPRSHAPQAWPTQFNSVLLALHEAHFAGPFLRLLFVIAGLVGTALIATGLLLWSAKREAKAGAAGRTHVGYAVVSVLNAGTIVGLPIGIAAYFWANRLLPVGMPSRGAMEMNWIFIAWGTCLIYAVWRPRGRIWVELCWLAAAAYALIPIVNALTTDRHLGATIPGGDWVLAGFDLSALTVGGVFALVARMLSRSQHPASRNVVPPAVLERGRL